VFCKTPAFTCHKCQTRIPGAVMVSEYVGAYVDSS